METKCCFFHSSTRSSAWREFLPFQCLSYVYFCVVVVVHYLSFFPFAFACCGCVLVVFVVAISLLYGVCNISSILSGSLNTVLHSHLFSSTLTYSIIVCNVSPLHTWKCPTVQCRRDNITEKLYTSILQIDRHYISIFIMSTDFPYFFLSLPFALAFLLSWFSLLLPLSLPISLARSLFAIFRLLCSFGFAWFFHPFCSDRIRSHIWESNVVSLDDQLQTHTNASNKFNIFSILWPQNKENSLPTQRIVFNTKNCVKQLKKTNYIKWKRTKLTFSCIFICGRYIHNLGSSEKFVCECFEYVTTTGNASKRRTNEHPLLLLFGLFVIPLFFFLHYSLFVTSLTYPIRYNTTNVCMYFSNETKHLNVRLGVLISCRIKKSYFSGGVYETK